MIRTIYDFGDGKMSKKSIDDNTQSIMEKDTRRLKRNKIKRLNKWKNEGILKRKYEYTVQEKTSLAFRRRCLQKACSELGKPIVKRELNRFILTAKKGNKIRMAVAIKKWEDDLEFVKENL
jgi:hypothetical protein